MIQADLFTDGSVRSSVERSGIGGWVHCHRKPREVWYSFSEEIPYELAINSIEYQAVIFGLRASLALNVDYVHIHTDSSIVVKQLRGEFQVHTAKLLHFRNEAYELLKQFQRWRIVHVPREKNRRADILAGAATGRKDALLKIDHINPGGRLDQILFGEVVPC